MEGEELWADLRQGARNVAGVSWQVTVSVHLLIAGYAGDLDIVRITPEGYEDVDCEDSGGERTFVQMKEADGGSGRLAAAAIGDALAHAEASARGSQIALITDASLGSGIVFTGWTATLAGQEAAGLDDVIDGLVDHGYTSVEAKGIVERARIVHLPYRVREMSDELLVRATGCHPAVAGIVVERLTQMLTAASADQRRTTANAAKSFRTSDIEAVLADVQDTVNLEGLERAYALGICGPADFSRADTVPARTFYLGVDGRPGHIASNLDVVRPVEMAGCADGLLHEQSVLIMGPSGAGKSILLWRAARDLVPAARVIRVRRVSSDDDSAALARHVGLMRPTEYSPVVVVADDLGRPTMANWPAAALLLRELPHTFLLTAARAEDFHPSMLVGSTRVVRPVLDPAVAQEIGTRIREAGIAEGMDVHEALESSEGLLMEFLALLTTGKRLRQVLGSQVAALAEPGRELQRDVARLLTAAHALGLSLSADRLGATLGVTDGVAAVGDALGVLRDEHIVVEDGRRWRGLHELRSATISELLHESPPPTVGATWSRIVDLVDPALLGWMLRRVGERDPESLTEVMPAIGRLLAHPDRTAAEVARTLEGAERADNARYVQASLPVLRQSLRPGLTVGELSFLVYSIRNHSMSWEPIDFENWDNMVARLTDVAQQLPLRADFDTTLKSACDSLTPAALARLLAEADLEDAVRLLEAGREYLAVPASIVRDLIDRSPTPHDAPTALLYSRLIAASSRHTTTDQYESVLGSLADRAMAVAAADPWTLEISIDRATSKINVVRLLPLEAEPPPGLSWDIPRANAGDTLHAETMGCLERLVDACPELTQFEIRTVTASGAFHRIADHEPAHKDMARTAFPRREAVRQSVGHQAALLRATASQTWTEVVLTHIEVAAELERLVSDLPLRAKTNDNSRRRQEWRGRLLQLRHRLATLDPPPMTRGTRASLDQGHQDDLDRTTDVTSRALRTTVDALDRVCPDDAVFEMRPRAFAMDLRSAAAELRRALAEGRTVLDHLGSPIPDGLVSKLDRAANLFAAIHYDPTSVKHIRADAPLESGDEIWAKTREDAAAGVGALLADRFSSIASARVQRISDPDPYEWTLDDSGWLVTAAIEDFDSVAGLFSALPDSDREQVESRLVALAVGFMDPSTGSEKVGQDDERTERRRVSLDVAFQLNTTSPGRLLPLTPVVAAEWADAGGIVRLPLDRETPASLLERLVERSARAALVRMRRLPLPTVESKPAVNALETSDGFESNDFGGDSIGEALRQLDLHVASEEAGTATTALAGVVLLAVNGDTPTEQEAALIAAMATIQLARFDGIDGLEPY